MLKNAVSASFVNASIRISSPNSAYIVITVIKIVQKLPSMNVSVDLFTLFTGSSEIDVFK
jgi:hypothetical protein